MDRKQEAARYHDLPELTLRARERQLTTLSWLLGLGALLIGFSAALLISEQERLTAFVTQSPPARHHIVFTLLCCAFAIVQGGAIAAWRSRVGQAARTAARRPVAERHWLLRLLRRCAGTADLRPRLLARACGHRPPRVLSGEQISWLQNACAQELGAFIRAMLLSGCRPGELAALRAADVRCDALQIRSSRTLERRRVPLTEIAAGFFEQQIVFKAPADPALSQSDGRPWRRRVLTRALRDTCLRARIEPAIRFRDLRHTFAAQLIDAGVPLLDVTSALGYRGTSVVERALLATAISHGTAGPQCDEELRASIRTRLMTGEIPQSESELLWMFDGEQRCLICGVEIDSNAAAYELVGKDGSSSALHERCEAMRRSECARLEAEAIVRERAAPGRASFRLPKVFS